MDALDTIYRTHAPHIRATLIRLLGSFDLAEEALQSAFLAAASRWPIDGTPENPRAWLISTGRFRMIDTLRRQARFAELEPQVISAMETDYSDPADAPFVVDDMLRLIFTCCHPALAPDAQTSLCLREICGLTTEAIAAAFLVKPATIAQRIVRAKTRLRNEKIPYEVPEKPEMAMRLDDVLRVIYLVFSEGYATSTGPELIRTDLCAEAIRLARLLRSNMKNPDIDGLLGLMLLQSARQAARLDADGNVTPLTEQDRTLWDPQLAREGRLLIRDALARPPLSTYTLQGAISAVHADAQRTGTIDWTAIIGYYDLLLIADPGPVVELNRAIAIGMRDGAEQGLLLVDRLTAEGALAGYRYVHLTRADFLRQLDRQAEARGEYRKALAMSPSEPERNFIEKRLAGLGV